MSTGVCFLSGQINEIAVANECYPGEDIGIIGWIACIHSNMDEFFWVGTKSDTIRSWDDPQWCHRVWTKTYSNLLTLHDWSFQIGRM